MTNILVNCFIQVTQCYNCFCRSNIKSTTYLFDTSNTISPELSHLFLVNRLMYNRLKSYSKLPPLQTVDSSLRHPGFWITFLNLVQWQTTNRTGMTRCDTRPVCDVTRDSRRSSGTLTQYANHKSLLSCTGRAVRVLSLTIDQFQYGHRWFSFFKV